MPYIHILSHKAKFIWKTNTKSMFGSGKKSNKELKDKINLVNEEQIKRQKNTLVKRARWAALVAHLMLT